MRAKRRATLIAAIVMALSAAAWASGPRYVSGPPFFTGRAGVAVGWRQTNLLYSTDPGDLSANVNHAAADALVAAAAGVWNLPIANITVSRGGALAEHVSGLNVYMDTSGVVFPDDVMSANAAAIPIAVIYDADGSVTDTLLGMGASDPSGCRQNAVTESVDQFDPAGYILHAVLVLNGRCTGPALEQQIQLRYQLMRAFGRVLGLAWSQTNDNVFTGTPTPTYAQAMHWPIMHPIDILCGPYSYQCMPSPFQLRPDDLSAMVALYPIGQNTTLAPGKQISLRGAQEAEGTISFPNRQGMAGVNVVVRRRRAYELIPDAWFEASAVTGASFRSADVSPFAGSDPSAYGSFGTQDQSALGYYFIAYLPLLDTPNWQSLIVSTEPVNALYTGAYSLGPYGLGDVSPAGSPPMAETAVITPEFGDARLDFLIADAPARCGQGADGTAAAPMQTPATGWWEGLLCGYGHASYVSADVKPGRTFTVEVTALDEQGFATEAKAMPVIGLFAPGDGASTVPSLDATLAAFQGLGVGTTTLNGQTGQLTRVRVGIADQRGDGRPDFRYQARFFYADDVLPARIPTAGKTVTISGMGFRAGNAVQVNGVAVKVLSWSTNAIVFTAPTLAAAQASEGAAVDVTVMDGGTGASSTMSGVLTYDSSPNLPNQMEVVTAQSGTVFAGTMAPVPFAVRVLAGDGVTPVASTPVVFSVTNGSAQYAICGAATCTVQTDANGMATSGVTPTTAGAVTLQATDGALMQSSSFMAEAQTNSMVLLSAPAGDLNVGEMAQTRFIVRDYAADGYTGLPGRLITFRVTVGSALLSGCFASVCSVTTDASGTAQSFVMPTAAGPVTLEASDGDARQTISFVAVNDTDVMQVTTTPSTSAFVSEPAGLFVIRLLHRDGISADFYQTITLSGPPGVIFGICGSNVCQMTTDSNGGAGTGVIVQKTGTFTIQVSYGAVVQRATITVTERTMQLRILSAPTGEVALGTTASIPFSAEVIGLDGVTPMTGILITLAGPPDAVILNACRIGTCLLAVDGNGIVSTTVTPLKPGPITLSAVYTPLTQTATFTATGPGVSMHVLTQPGTAPVAVGDVVLFTVQMFEADGVTPGAGRLVTFSVTDGSLAFLGCGFAACLTRTDGDGKASFAGIPQRAGAVSVRAENDSVGQTMSFTATQKTYVLRLESAPAGLVYTGGAAAGLFTVRVLESDGVTPAAGRNVNFTTVSGSVQFGACPEISCAVVTDATGLASTSVIPFSTGGITVMAAEGSNTQVASFQAATNSDTMLLMGTPGSSVTVGATALTPFVVRVLLPDGTTPATGVGVTFSIAGRGTGMVQFAGCGASVCTLMTDNNGVASSSVIGVSAGALTLVATADASTGAQAISFGYQVVGKVYSLNAVEAKTFVAEGVVLRLKLDATVIGSGVAAIAQAVHWSAGSGTVAHWSPGSFVLDVNDTVTDIFGATSIDALVGPLAAGAQATATACAGPQACADFVAVGVSAGEWSIGVVSGARQAVSGGAALLPVLALVTDGGGHPVASAPVSVYQEVRATNMDCPDRGRCPTAPVVLKRVMAMTTDANGLVTVVPLTVSGMATKTQIAMSVGTQGFTTVVLSSAP